MPDTWHFNTVKLPCCVLLLVFTFNTYTHNSYFTFFTTHRNSFESKKAEALRSSITLVEQQLRSAQERVTELEQQLVAERAVNETTVRALEKRLDEAAGQVGGVWWQCDCFCSAAVV